MIELLLVIAVIGLITGLLLPAVQKARKAAYQARESQQAYLPAEKQGTAPQGLRPVIDNLKLDMNLRVSYHQIDVVVYTRYEASCTGEILFQSPQKKQKEVNEAVLLFVPFPEDIVEARDVELKLIGESDQQPRSPDQLLYHRNGIYCTVAMPPKEAIRAEFRFTAHGRKQLEYYLPPAQQMKSLAITLSLSGAKEITIPDEALQPTSASTHRLEWQIRNLVSDRHIQVLIPESRAPAARVFSLWRLVAIALLLFGAGFLYLSEQAQPGQLDRFRLAHFALLALTYSLFFIILTVLELQADLGTPAAILASAVFSLPLLMLHVSGVLGFRFALTRAMPLAVLSLGLVLIGVYGDGIEVYAYIGTVILIIAYLTITFPSWAAKRAAHQQARDSAYVADRQALMKEITSEMGRELAGLLAAETAAKGRLKLLGSVGLSTNARVSLERATEPVATLTKEHEQLTQRMADVPIHRDWLQPDVLGEVKREAENLRERITQAREELNVHILRAQASIPAADPQQENAIHCAACGQHVPQARFCPQCGAVQAMAIICPGCEEKNIVPLHLISESDDSSKELFCMSCGTGLSEAMREGV